MRILAYALLLTALLGSGWAAWFFFGHPKPEENPEYAAFLRQVAELEPRAAAGNPDAMVDLGWLIVKPDSRRPDPGRALDLFRAAAAKGSVRGQYAVGWAHAHGRGTARDLRAAAEWYRVAATAGNSADAQFALGEMYFNGRGVANDYDRAIEMYRKAAFGGHPAARYLMGVMYEEGWGVKRDPVAAYMWLTLAAAEEGRVRGYNAAFDPRARREKLKLTLNTTQINLAERRAREMQGAAAPAEAGR